MMVVQIVFLIELAGGSLSICCLWQLFRGIFEAFRLSFRVLFFGTSSFMVKLGVLLVIEGSIKVTQTA